MVENNDGKLQIIRCLPQGTILKLEGPDGNVKDYIVENSIEGDSEEVALKLTTRPEDAGKVASKFVAGARVIDVIPHQISFNVEYNPENKEYPKFIHNKVLFGETVKSVYKISLEISSEWLLNLSRLRLAFAMSLNERLGEKSPIHIFNVPPDIINKIGENIVGNNPLKVDIQKIISKKEVVKRKKENLKRKEKPKGENLNERNIKLNE